MSEPRTAALVALSFVLTLGASLFLLFAPSYDTSGGGTRTLREENGDWVIGLLAAPVGVTLATLLAQGSPAARQSRIAAAFAMGALSVLGAASVGVLYWPATAVMLAAAVRRP